MKARTLSIAALVAVVMFGLNVVATAGDGQCSNAVAKAFKGQIIVSEAPLTGGDTDKATIAAYKAQRLDAVASTENGDGLLEWSFHWTAFLKAKGYSDVTLQFFKGEDYKADQHLSNVDPALHVIRLNITINEDEGPSKGDYTLKLVGTKGGKEAVLASTKLKLK